MKKVCSCLQEFNKRHKRWKWETPKIVNNSTLKKLWKQRVFTRFSRFLGLCLFTSASARFHLPFFATLQKPRVFARFWNLGANLERAFRLPNLIFGASRANVRVQTAFGSFCAAFALQKLIENLAFSRVFYVSVPSQTQCVLHRFFQACCENHAFSRVFQTLRVRFRACFFVLGVRFLVCFFVVFICLLFKKWYPKLILGISRAMQAPKNLIV